MPRAGSDPGVTTGASAPSHSPATTAGLRPPMAEHDSEPKEVPLAAPAGLRPTPSAWTHHDRIGGPLPRADGRARGPGKRTLHSCSGELVPPDPTPNPWPTAPFRAEDTEPPAPAMGSWSHRTPLATSGRSHPSGRRTLHTCSGELVPPDPTHTSGRSHPAPTGRTRGTPAPGPAPDPSGPGALTGWHLVAFDTPSLSASALGRNRAAEPARGPSPPPFPPHSRQRQPLRHGLSQKGCPWR